MRACQPAVDGYVERDGVKVFYEVFGQGESTVLLLPTWSIIHSRVWKLQVPHLARHYRVLTLDGRGNGRSDRPARVDAYRPEEFVADALAVLDAAGADQAVVAGPSRGAVTAALLAALHPDRILGVVFVSPTVPLAPPLPGRRHSFTDPLHTTEGWAKFNQHYWRAHYPEFARFFFEQVFTEPHSTKPIEDTVGWALETDPDTLILIETATVASELRRGDTFRTLCQQIACPTVVIVGAEDAVTATAQGQALAEVTGGSLVTVEGGGHAPHVRDPVLVNRLLRQFIDGLHSRPQPRTWTRALRRPPKALYISSPIGLGHARRDLAIVHQLRAQHPELQVDWLAQDPVTRVLDGAGEQIHPASRHLANESAHIESESAEHDLHCFQAWRRMDEILVANYMVVDDLLDQEHYDLVIGDEAWEVDHYLHENPEHKRTAYAWLTDFVGWLPMPDGGQREAELTADYNAEMLEHIARYPRLRDRAIFVGNPDDIVLDTFGPDLPSIREWTKAHYDFSGYITGFDPAALADRQELRRRLGYHPDQQVLVVTVGGTGVGAPLLGKILEAFPLAKRAVSGLRMVVVTGPRIDPASLPAAHQQGLELRAFVPDLYRHLAASDLAIIQGGLTTAMELTANGRPFLYFPLAHHFEQTFHVPHRLARYRAGQRMDYTTTDPDAIAAAIASQVGRDVHYRPVERDGAHRAAALLAELL
jgi:pimeloyl-ACP methyl ester carboxylesterase/predicted glycosyltransferase